MWDNDIIVISSGISLYPPPPLYMQWSPAEWGEGGHAYQMSTCLPFKMQPDTIKVQRHDRRHSPSRQRAGRPEYSLQGTVPGDL